jgi:hypothetical protein
MLLKKQTPTAAVLTKLPEPKSPKRRKKQAMFTSPEELFKGFLMRKSPPIATQLEEHSRVSRTSEETIVKPQDASSIVFLTRKVITQVTHMEESTFRRTPMGGRTFSDSTYEEEEVVEEEEEKEEDREERVQEEVEDGQKGDEEWEEQEEEEEEARGFPPFRIHFEVGRVTRPTRRPPPSRQCTRWR